jgi:hypothetical protein
MKTTYMGLAYQNGVNRYTNMPYKQLVALRLIERRPTQMAKYMRPWGIKEPSK